MHNDEMDVRPLGPRVQGIGSGTFLSCYTITVPQVEECKAQRVDSRSDRIGREIENRDPHQYAWKYPDRPSETNIADLHKRLSLIDVFGSSSEVQNEISRLLWDETRLSTKSSMTEDRRKMEVRLANEYALDWGATLLTEAEDRAPLHSQVFLQRPLISNSRAVLSYIISLHQDHNLQEGSAGGISSLEETVSNQDYMVDCPLRSIDIGFLTIEVRLHYSNVSLEPVTSCLRRQFESQLDTGLSGRATGLEIKMISAYLHPSFRRNGFGSLMSEFSRVLVGYAVGEIAEQATRWERIRLALCQNTLGLLQDQNEHQIVLMLGGRSWDLRGDAILRRWAGGVFADLSHDRYSPASNMCSPLTCAARTLIRRALQTLPSNELEALSTFLKHILRESVEKERDGHVVAESVIVGDQSLFVVDLIGWSSEQCPDPRRSSS